MEENYNNDQESAQSYENNAEEQYIEEHEQPEELEQAEEPERYNDNDASADAAAAEPHSDDHPQQAYNGQADKEIDFSDPKCFNEEIRKIDEARSIIYHGLDSLCRESLEKEPEVKLLDICADLQAEEEALFSPIPVFIACILEKERLRHEGQLANIAPHDEISVFQSARNTRFSEERRAFVDPGIPLQLPFDSERFRNEHPERYSGVGRYHDLFFGDPANVQFPPPKHNKRREIEERNQAYPNFRGGQRRSYDVPLRKPKKVPHDFVPSCAFTSVGNQRK